MTVTKTAIIVIILFLSLSSLYITVSRYFVNLRRVDTSVCTFITSSSAGGFREVGSQNSYDFTVRNVCDHPIEVESGALIFKQGEQELGREQLSFEPFILESQQSTTSSGFYNQKQEYAAEDKDIEFEFQYLEQ